jgi:hypothetical protein
MMYGGSLASRRLGSRDDLSVEFRELDLDQRLPTSARGSVATAAARLAELGIAPGRYSGAEQLFSGAAAGMAAAIDAALCEIRMDGSLVVTGGSTGEVTTFTWVNDRWRWSPHSGVTVEAAPQRVGAITVVDFFACEGPKQSPAARFYLAIDRRV